MLLPCSCAFEHNRAAMPGPEGDAMRVCTSTKGVRAVRRRTAGAPDYGRVSAAGRWWCMPLPVLQGGRRRAPASLQAPHGTAQAQPWIRWIHKHWHPRKRTRVNALGCAPLCAAQAESRCTFGSRICQSIRHCSRSSAAHDIHSRSTLVTRLSAWNAHT